MMPSFVGHKISLLLARIGIGRQSVASPSAVKLAEMKDTSDEGAVRLALCELWEAYRLKDTTRLRDIIDDAYSKAEDVSKDELIARYTGRNFLVKTVDIDYQAARVVVDENQALVTYTARSRHLQHGVQFRVVTDSTDVFIKRDSKWRLYRSTNNDRLMEDDV